MVALDADETKGRLLTYVAPKPGTRGCGPSSSLSSRWVFPLQDEPFLAGFRGSMPL